MATTMRNLEGFFVWAELLGHDEEARMPAPVRRSTSSTSRTSGRRTSR